MKQQTLDNWLMFLLFATILFAAALWLTACNAAEGSVIAPTPTVTQAAKADEPAPAVPTPAVTVAPCSVLPPPAPGSARMLLCITGENGTEAIDRAELTYAGQFVGYSDVNGQFMLGIRGYGGTQTLLVFHAYYNGGVPKRVELVLREDHISEHVEMGPSIR